MNIYAKSKRDLKTITALVHLHIFGKNEPKKRMIMYFVIYFILGAAILFESILFDSYVLIKWYVIAMVVVDLMFLHMYFIASKKNYKSMGKMADIEDEYRFTDDKLIIKSFGADSGYSSITEMDYAILCKVYETSEYFFLYQSMRFVWIVDKSSMTCRDISDIKEKFIDIFKGKYIVCNY